MDTIPKILYKYCLFLFAFLLVSAPAFSQGNVSVDVSTITVSGSSDDALGGTIRTRNGIIGAGLTFIKGFTNDQTDFFAGPSVLLYENESRNLSVSWVGNAGFSSLHFSTATVVRPLVGSGFRGSYGELFVKINANFFLGTGKSPEEFKGRFSGGEADGFNSISFGIGYTVNY